MRRHQAAGVGGQEPVINEQDNAAVLRRADDPASRLQNLVHAGEAVGIVKAGAARLLKVIAQLLLPRADLRQARADDGCTDEAFPRQIDALAKNAAQHRKAQQRSAVGFLKLRQKLRAFFLVHGAFLTEGRLVRVAGGEVLPHLL